MKNTTPFSNFEALDIRVGHIIKVENSKTQKPTYKLTIDFGPEIGKKVSCGAYRNYPPEKLIGKQIIAIVNFGPKKMGPETSECLVLGVRNNQGETIYLTTESDVPLGNNIF